MVNITCRKCVRASNIRFLPSEEKYVCDCPYGIPTRYADRIRSCVQYVGKDNNDLKEDEENE